jgi:hypothetical protein
MGARQDGDLSFIVKEEEQPPKHPIMFVPMVRVVT